MTQQETTEGKRIIARFMGWADSPYGNLPDKMYSEDLSLGRPLDCFNYDSSMDELAPVLQKIPTLRFRHGRFHVRIVVMSSETYCRIESKAAAFRNSTHNKKPLAEVVFATVVEFVKWYNQNKPV